MRLEPFTEAVYRRLLQEGYCCLQPTWQYNEYETGGLSTLVVLKAQKQPAEPDKSIYLDAIELSEYTNSHTKRYCVMS